MAVEFLSNTGSLPFGAQFPACDPHRRYPLRMTKAIGASESTSAVTYMSTYQPAVRGTASHFCLYVLHINHINMRTKWDVFDDDDSQERFDKKPKPRPIVLYGGIAVVIIMGVGILLLIARKKNWSWATGTAPNLTGTAPNLRGAAPNLRGAAPNLRGTGKARAAKIANGSPATPNWYELHKAKLCSNAASCGKLLCEGSSDTQKDCLKKVMLSTHPDRNSTKQAIEKFYCASECHQAINRVTPKI